LELAKIERQAIYEKFNEFDGNRTKTANALGIGRTNLIKKLKKYGLF
jgi:DNA-binding NtrC family response regulator